MMQLKNAPAACRKADLLQQLFGYALGHGLVGPRARVQMVARIEPVAELFRVVVTAHRLVKIDAAVKIGGGTEPFVERHADDVAVFVVGAPAVNRE